MSITYPINALPRAIPLCLGVQSEYGARPISIDVSEWVGRWPDIIVSVQPVRPGEDVSYLAAGVTRSGNIVTWTPNAYDTEIPGTGSVEIIGLADGVKIIRTGAATSIAPTKSSVSKTPEDPMAAWADSVIRAGEQAKSSAEEALLLAQAANKSANNANASAVQAQSSQRAAATSASQAATYRTDAVNAMNAAQNSQTQAKASEQAASTLANAAYKSQQRAEAAAKRAEDAANSMGGGAVSPGDGKLKADAIMCDKSGEVVSIADASEMDALSVVSHIDSPEGVTEITLTRTGKNIWGGMALAQSIASQVDGAVLDVDAKTVTYDAGKIKAVNVFDKFELGKRYTVIFARDESKSKGTTANIRIIYDTGEALNISFNSGNTAVVTTAANKNVEKLLGYNSSGPTCLLYEQCGVFEGVLTAEDFVPSEAETFTVTLPEAVTDGTFEWATGVLTINQDGTSRTVQLDAQPIALQDGYNTLWSSTGQTDVRYVADTKAYVDGHGADADSEYAENAGYADNAGYAEEAGDAQTVKGRDIAAEVDAISKEMANKVTGVYVEVEDVVRNLFNKDTVTAESYVGANGKVSPLATFCASDFIPVLAGETYTRSFTQALSYAATYDANKAFVAMIGKTQTFTVPDGALYVRITVPNTYVESAMLVKGTNVPDTYIPYDPNGGGESGGVKIADFHNTFTTGAKKDIKEYVLSETVPGAWNGKKVLCIGDSLTRAGTWHEQLEEMLGMSVYKKALGGIALENLFISDGLLDMDGNASALSSADVADKDLVIFFAGTNNRTISDGNGAGTPVYTIGEVGDVWNGSGNKTIAGVVQYAINQIYALLREASNLTCRVMFVTPFYAGKCADRNYDGAHDYNGNGVSLKTIAAMMEEVCAANGVPCYNAFANSGINPNTWAVYTRNTEAETNGVVNDQLHLNMDKGYPHLGKCIAKFVAAN